MSEEKRYFFAKKVIPHALEVLREYRIPIPPQYQDTFDETIGLIHCTDDPPDDDFLKDLWRETTGPIGSISIWFFRLESLKRVLDKIGKDTHAKFVVIIQSNSKECAPSTAADTVIWGERQTPQIMHEYIFVATCDDWYDDYTRHIDIAKKCSDLLQELWGEGHYFWVEGGGRLYTTEDTLTVYDDSGSFGMYDIKRVERLIRRVMQTNERLCDHQLKFITRTRMTLIGKK